MKIRGHTTRNHHNPAWFLFLCLLVLCFTMVWGWQKNERDRILIQAVRQGDMNRVCAVLIRGADPNVNVYEQYPILAPFKSLVGKGDDLTYPALLHALLSGRSDIAHALLEYGADPNARDNFDCPALMWAVHKHDAIVVEDLLKRGALVNARDAWGQTALCLAQQTKNTKIVQILKQYGGTL